MELVEKNPFGYFDRDLFVRRLKLKFEFAMAEWVELISILHLRQQLRLVEAEAILVHFRD